MQKIYGNFRLMIILCKNNKNLLNIHYKMMKKMR